MTDIFSILGEIACQNVTLYGPVVTNWDGFIVLMDIEYTGYFRMRQAIREEPSHEEPWADESCNEKLKLGLASDMP